MKKTFILCTLFVLLLTGCDNNNFSAKHLPDIIEIDTTAVCCGILNPVENMEWLHDIVSIYLSDSIKLRETHRSELEVSSITYTDTEEEEYNAVELYYYSYNFPWTFDQVQAKKRARSAVPPCPFFEVYDCEGNRLSYEQGENIRQNGEQTIIARFAFGCAVNYE